MRNISFAHTTQQISARTKTVTRRTGWRFANPGDLLQAIEKGQGLKKGEHVNKLCVVRLVTVRTEPLNYILYYRDDGMWELEREGFGVIFPHTPAQFVEFFCDVNPSCTPDTLVTRLEFEYVD